MSFVNLFAFAFWFYMTVNGMLTDPRGTMQLVLAPVRFLRTIGLRIVWSVVALFLFVKFLYDGMNYFYLMVTGGLLPSIAAANPVPVLLSDDYGWLRVVHPPPVETRLLEAFWNGTLFRVLVAETKHAMSSCSPTLLPPPLPAQPEPAQVPLPLPAETRAALRRAAGLPPELE
ncbi:hypothetical protein BGZ81_002363 [Podila clonocystis]|nr:hypothetical protein BGZ81_002363 [Podila clonocystis]